MDRKSVISLENLIYRQNRFSLEKTYFLSIENIFYLQNIFFMDRKYRNFTTKGRILQKKQRMFGLLMVPGKLGPWKIRPLADLRHIGAQFAIFWKIRPRQIRPLEIWVRQIGPCKFGPCISYICIGYTLPTIGGINV